MIGQSIVFFILGTLFGSFGSVVLARLQGTPSKKQRLSVALWRSECPNCKHVLARHDLMPIVSFMTTRWLCRYCHKPISKSYPMLELLMGIVFVLTFLFVQALLPWAYRTTPFYRNLGIFLAVNRGLMLIAFHDFQTYELHVPLWLFVTWVLIISQFFLLIGNFQTAFRGSLLASGLFYAVYRWAKRYMRHRYKQPLEGLGEWDTMIAFTIGLLMPFIFQFAGQAPNFADLFTLLVWRVILSCLLGILTFGILKAVHNKSGTALPFIPALIAGFWLLVFLAPRVL